MNEDGRRRIDEILGGLGVDGAPDEGSADAGDAPTDADGV